MVRDSWNAGIRSAGNTPVGGIKSFANIVIDTSKRLFGTGEGSNGLGVQGSNGSGVQGSNRSGIQGANGSGVEGPDSQLQGNHSEANIDLNTETTNGIEGSQPSGFQPEGFQTIAD